MISFMSVLDAITTFVIWIAVGAATLYALPFLAFLFIAALFAVLGAFRWLEDLSKDLRAELTTERVAFVAEQKAIRLKAEAKDA